MTGRFFLDTNILIYATLQSDPRAAAARALLARRGSISVQVLNEFANVAAGKLQRPWPEIATTLDAIRTLCHPAISITIATHESALTIAQDTGYALYDALIIAAALEAGCDTLFSADLQHHRVIRTLTIRNPFVACP